MKTKSEVFKNGNNLEIDELIITPAALDRLKFLQQDENAVLEMFRGYIADAVCFIATKYDEHKDDPEELLRFQTLQSDLSYCRDYLLDLAKPFVLE